MYLCTMMAGDATTFKQAKRLGMTHLTLGGNYVRLLSKPVHHGQFPFDMSTIARAI